MDQMTIIYMHLFTVLPAILIGTFMMFYRKGGVLHHYLGRAYMVLMFTTALLSLGISSGVGPSILGHFGPIHILSVMTLYTVPTALLAARRGQIKAHRNAMIQLYCGACLVAGIFALMPGRMLHGMLFA
ncbi:DUF2306 domain-containing protein [Veronia pacifica]|uniref:DUF2306 domain-containing protein n=1 Tax=Veronia pacifica TaxID=1080227 RepID=A0A1C3ESE8_9GAMM|nr:DUF2306 domain-containing protein [Veronia pacifica]ODA36202.1 hypothetical protein A8L45_00945 [Veronia pacifica]